MKTIIENTIEIAGIGHPDTKTIFTVKETDPKTYPFYKSLDRFCGTKKTIWFKYLDNDVEKESKITLVIPKELNEQQVKDFILSAINKKLAE